MYWGKYFQVTEKEKLNTEKPHNLWPILKTLDNESRLSLHTQKFISAFKRIRGRHLPGPAQSSQFPKTLFI
jgi:hypothetical protein